MGIGREVLDFSSSFFGSFSNASIVGVLHAGFSPLSGKYTAVVIQCTIPTCLMKPDKNVRCTYRIPGCGGRW